MYHADVTSQMLQWFRVIFETEKKNNRIGCSFEKRVGVYSLKGERFPSLSRKVEWKRK